MEAIRDGYQSCQLADSLNDTDNGSRLDTENPASGPRDVGWPMARLHEECEWDADKAKKNLVKHKVSFDDAMGVLCDEEGDVYHIEDYDDAHSIDEDRYLTTGSHPSDRSIILRIAWTDRSIGERRVTRIISARRADTSERSD